MEELTTKQITAAVTNDPEFSEHEIEFGGKTYKLVDLPYDDYIKFLALLQPFLEALTSKLISGSMSDIGFGDLIKHCGDALPKMAYYALKQVDEDITESYIKQVGKTPFRIAPVVLKQIEKNNVIGDISDFFVQILPLIQNIKQ